MKRARHMLVHAGAAHRRGFALIIVLLVLMALLVLATPFLLSARNADRASSQIADRVEARVALDTASRHAQHLLADSFQSLNQDRSPYYDSLAELEVDNRFDSSFYDANDPHAAMWDVDVTDVAGQIDLNSASPHVIANLLGLYARTSEVIQADAKTIPLSSVAHLEPKGFVEIEGELISYTTIGESSLIELTRGVLGPMGDQEWRGGPWPSVAHGIGAVVIDQRAFAPALWRLINSNDELRRFESLEDLPSAGPLARAAALDPAAGTALGAELVKRLSHDGTVYASACGGPTWQRAARITSEIEGGKDGKLLLDNARWVNPGTTVRIRGPVATELALVTGFHEGALVLDRVLQNDSKPYEAVLDVLARRPVNLNTANKSVLIVLFSNLQVAGRNSRITSEEAATLADVVLASRPFTGFEDFLERVVLPASGIEKLPSDAPSAPDVLVAGDAVIDPWDALALYRNGLNANDSGLAFSTMPFSFVSRDTYALQLRASVNAPSGVERQSAVRDDVTLVAPQKELIKLWARQEDFEEELRIAREAPWWLTGPNSVSRWDGGAVPPSRLWAQMGTFEGQVFLPGVSDPGKLANLETPPTAEHVFGSREDDGWAQLMPGRVSETVRTKDRVLHFDHETRDLEGRSLPDQPEKRPLTDKLVQWLPPNNAGSGATQTAMLRCPSSSLWIKPRSLADGTILDVAGDSRDVDRVALLFEGGDLVLRVLDGMGDHRDTGFIERGEMRYALAPSTTSPGLPVDVWSHVAFDVRGNRPNQMSLLVNGLAAGVRTPGMTRLSAALPSNGFVLAVESIEGFPDNCVVRIGAELIEVVVDRASGSMSAFHNVTGPLAGFGGRMARERVSDLIDDPTPSTVPAPPAYPAGTPVELYGYAWPLASLAGNSLPIGEVPLQRELGVFRAARVLGVVGMSQGGEQIDYQTTFGPIPLGYGLPGDMQNVAGLELIAADDGFDPAAPTPAADFMSAFEPGGGYAVLLQAKITLDNNQNPKDADNAYLFGIDVIRYGGWSGTQLLNVQRNQWAGIPTLNVQGDASDELQGPRSLILKWHAGMVFSDLTPFQSLLDLQTYVIPISLAVPGAGGLSFLQGAAGDSRFAQITHANDAEHTEWVRYDFFDAATGQLVRASHDALGDALHVVSGGTIREFDPPQPGGGGPGTGAPGGGAGGQQLTALAPPAAAPPQADPQYDAQYLWDPRQGRDENVDKPFSRAMASRLQFRGVLGTYSHRHAAGSAKILPCFMVEGGRIDGGRVGRRDAIFLADADPNALGFPVLVHRGHLPAHRVGIYSWAQTGTNVTPGTQSSPSLSQVGFHLNVRWVALETGSPTLFLPNATSNQRVDSRNFARLSCFPSGERPRVPSEMALGGAAGNGTDPIPSVIVDEVVFADAQFTQAPPIGINPEETKGASLVLMEDFEVGNRDARIDPSRARLALADLSSTTHKYIAELPENGGLLRMGDEICAYQSRDIGTGTAVMCENGRGLLGTQVGRHSRGDPVLFLEHTVLGVLANNIAAKDAFVPLTNTVGFPSEGTVLIGEELIHYTRVRENGLEMPRASTQPGMQDGGGAGLFRARYGTSAAAHVAGEAVILFPFRYWDRYEEKADAPELSYFGLTLDQPAAFLSSVFFSKVDTDSARLGVLQRCKNAPWDADPESDKRLAVFFDGQKNGDAIPIGTQSDRFDWRVFVDYLPGAFDPVTGNAHGWRQTPRMRMFSAIYFAPSITLRSVER